MSNIVIWIEIALFVFTLIFHARVSWISDNLDLYQTHYLNNMNKSLNSSASNSRGSSLNPGQSVEKNKAGYDA